MIQKLFTVFLAAACLAGGARAEKLKVVATIPDLADLARAIGGERVVVTSICHGRENVHSVRPAPSDLVALSRADVLVQLGLALESTWLPGLLQAARNEKIQPGQPGFVNASEGWEAIQVPSDLSRQGGDLHPFGNPHMNLDPRAGRHIAGSILACLVAVAPGSRAEFEANHAAYLERLTEAEARWQAIGARLAGTKVVTYHQEFDYLAELYGIEIAGTVELKPGIPPTATHLVRLQETMKAGNVRVVLTAAWSNNKHAKSVAQKVGGRVLEVPTLVGGAPGADSWIAMQDLIHERLLEALVTGAGGED
jgi:zinc/manganese transport system substrate-binding protein